MSFPYSKNIDLLGLYYFRQFKQEFDRKLVDYFNRPEKYGILRFQLPNDGNVSMSALDLTDFKCSCSFFKNNHNCEHKIAFDLYFKSLSDEIQNRIKYSQLNSFATELMQDIPDEEVFEDDRELKKYSLGAQLDVNGEYLLWTLKVKPEESNRYYIVKDISRFIESIYYGYPYNISTKFKEEVMSLESFNEQEQACIRFLYKNYFDTDKQLYYESFGKNGARYLQLSPGYMPEACQLFQELEEFRFVDGTTEYLEFFVDETPSKSTKPNFVVRKTSHKYLFDYKGGFGKVLYTDYLIRENHIYYIPEKYRIFLSRLQEWIDLYTKRYELSFLHQQKEEMIRFSNTLSMFANVQLIEELQAHPFVPSFYFSKDRSLIKVEMKWHFEKDTISSKDELVKLPYAYDEKLAKKIRYQFYRSGFQEGFSSSVSIELAQFFLNDLPKFQKLGEVELSEELQKLYIEDSGAINIIEQDGYLSVKFDFSMLSEKEVGEALKALWSQESHYQTKTGQVIVFNDESLKVAKGLQDIRAKFSKDTFKVHKSQAFVLADSVKNSDTVHFSKEFKQMAYYLANPNRFDAPPYEVNAQLRSYQKEGVQWMSMLQFHHFGGILADDMGLGKTLQTITFLNAHLKGNERVLILAPSSLLYNWKEEFRKFTPDVDVEVVYGNAKSRLLQIEKQATITITSYSSFRSDVEEYQKYHYRYLILDEAQMVKNSQTKIAHALREFDVETCFALSGTPIENRLEEIWSIFQFVLPGLLPSKKEFSKLTPEMVAKLIQPFILRRKKEEVVLELPPLNEHLYSNELTSPQKSLYIAQVQRMQDIVESHSDDELQKRKIELLAGLTRLRQICNTPSLFLNDYSGESGKMDSLIELLTTLREKGARPLIFSQFTKMLELIELELEKQGFAYFKLTGQTPSDERQEMVNTFNAGEKDCFLISLKAGGTGLNLTGADTVILCDLWWNPSVEMQAIGRSHRIGQTKQVDVYRLVTLGTIEEKIQQLQENKKELVNTVLEGQESKNNLTVEDIKEILGVHLSE